MSELKKYETDRWVVRSSEERDEAERAILELGKLPFVVTEVEGRWVAAAYR